MKPDGHWAKLARQRLPMLALFAAAAAGGVLAKSLAIRGDLAALAGLAFLSAAVRCSMDSRNPAQARRSSLAALWLCCGVACAFVAMTSWRAREAPARAFAATHPAPQVATVTARVIDTPAAAGEDRWVFRAKTLDVALAGWSGKLGLALQISWPGDPPAPGDLITATGSLAPIAAPRNPGEFDAKRWLSGRGIFSRLFVSEPADRRIVEPASPFSPLAVAWQAGNWVRKTLTAGLDPDSRQARLILAMTLGDTDGLGDGLLEDFRETGTFHLFSVSGLHVGMLGLLLWLGLGAAGLPRPVIVATIIPVLFFYALMTGWKPASVRAAIMAAFVIVGALAGRRPLVTNSLFAAAFTILLIDPLELFNAGFQLSFAVVLALVLLVGPVDATIRRPVDVDPFIPRSLRNRGENLRAALARWAAPLLAVAGVAWVGSFALTLTYFHLISVVGVAANVVCVPLAFVAMAVAMLALVAGGISAAAAAVFNNANWLFAGLLIGAVEWFAGLPGASFYATWPQPDRPPARVVVFDMGRGGAAALSTASGWWLLDSGPSRHAERTLLPFFRSQGVNTLEGLILTHGDSQHIGSALRIQETLRPRLLFESALDDRSPIRRQFREAAEEIDNPPVRLVPGDTLPLAHGAAIEILHPPEALEAELADDKALVVIFSAEGWRILFLSDTGLSARKALRSRRGLAADVIVAGAHSGGGTLDAGFFEATGARLLVATDAHFPSSERLPQETLAAAEAAGVRVFSQSQTGAVILDLRKSALEATGFVDGSRFVIER